MKHLSLNIILSLIALNLNLLNTAYAGDIKHGETLLKNNHCASCHGADFIKSTDNSIPSLAGQHRDYLIQALRQYRASDNPQALLSRKNAIMASNVKSLSNKDIEDIAAYLSQLKGHLSVNK